MKTIKKWSDKNIYEFENKFIRYILVTLFTCIFLPSNLVIYVILGFINTMEYTIIPMYKGQKPEKHGLKY
jgi:hypothetical protein